MFHIAHRFALTFILIASITILTACGGDGKDSAKKDASTTQPHSDKPAEKTTDKPNGSAQADPNVTKLFDGKTLTNWKVTEFGGQGEVEVKNGELLIHYGEILSGVNYTGKLPARMNYEINLEAKKVDGSDFFCGLTVPVKDKHISLILGGWGGGVAGLSSLDGTDASENETTLYQEFETGKWYKVKMQVLPEQINVWLNGKLVIDVTIKGREVSIRPEVELSAPFGICTFQTSAAYRNITFTKLDK
jgi:hypothetical protein